jgi:hypothetical protein
LGRRKTEDGRGIGRGAKSALASGRKKKEEKRYKKRRREPKKADTFFNISYLQIPHPDHFLFFLFLSFFFLLLSSVFPMASVTVVPKGGQSVFPWIAAAASWKVGPGSPLCVSCP